MTEVGSTIPAHDKGRSALRARLLTRGWEFSFFQAVWLLEKTVRDQMLVGGRGPVGRELLRFRPDVGLGFPPVDLWQITEVKDPIDDHIYYQVEVTFLGLYGVSTPLPLHYAVKILRSVEPAPAPADPAAAGEGAVKPAQPAPTPVRDFLDILHHRLISLFYRAWTKYRYHVTFRIPQRDVVTNYLLWLIGCVPTWSDRELGLDPIRMIRYAGLLTQRPKSGTGLEGLLLDYWVGLPVAVEQCVGRWVALKTDDLNRIGCDKCRLGEDLTVGEQVYDLNGEFRIVMGPVDWVTYVSFLPDGSRFAQTEALVRLYGQDPLAFSVEIILQAGEVPETKVSSDDQAGRLGFTSWVRTQEVAETSVTFDAASRYTHETLTPSKSAS